jgi:hypothetical protein
VSISQKIEGIAASVKGRAQNTGVQVTAILLRLFTGIILGYVLGLMAQEIMNFGNLVELFFVIAFTAFFYRISAAWSVFKIFMFDFLCILVLQILKMYILLAP